MNRAKTKQNIPDCPGQTSVLFFVILDKMSAAEAPSVEVQAAVAAPAVNPPVGDPAEGASENASLYVGDLDKDTQETHLFELFSEVHIIRFTSNRALVIECCE